jgi:hypothetical protein
MLRLEKTFPSYLTLHGWLSAVWPTFGLSSSDFNQSFCTNHIPLLGTCSVIILSLKKNTSKNILLFTLPSPPGHCVAIGKSG